MAEKVEFSHRISDSEAQVNMWLYDIERLNEAMKSASSLFINIRYETYFRAEPTILLSLTDALNEIYRVLRPMLYDTVQVKWDEKFTKTWMQAEAITSRNKILKANGNDHLVNCPNTFYYDLNILYNDLMTLRKDLKLGIPIEKFRSQTAKLKDAL